MEAVPEELRSLPQWVCWKRETRNDKETKIPISPVKGGNASTTDESTWGTFEQAYLYACQAGLAGIGFVFKAGGGYVGIDLDHVRDLETGTIEPWAMDIISRMDSYTELSQSETGLHIICKGSLPQGKRRRGQIEVYDQGRYFVMTGKPIEGTPTAIEDRQDELNLLHQTYLAEPSSPREAPLPEVPPFLDDMALLDRAMNASNGHKFRQLFAGKTQGYSSQSEADLALCCLLAFWTGRDAERMDRLFRQSGLMRDKWDEMRGQETYGQSTIQTAINRTSETYNPTPLPLPEFQDIPPATGKEWEAERCTDQGNARRMIRLFGHNLHYCEGIGGWFVWTEGRWKLDKGKVTVTQLGKETVQTVFADVPFEPDATKRKILLRWAKLSESAGKLDALLKMAWSEPGIPVDDEAWDTNPWLLTCRNGTIDLRTGELREHQREDLITKLAPVVYDAHAWDEVFYRYLDEVTNGDKEFQRFLQKAVGYSLTGCTDEEAFFLMLGPAATGKSTLIEAIMAMMGGYAAKASFETFLSKKANGGATPEVAALRGARLVTAVETAKNQQLAEPLIKELTGGDTITARHLFAEPISFKPQCKIWLAANEAPNITDTDTGIWRRLLRMPFEREIPVDRRDPMVKKHLCSEALPAILAWAVQGCLLWQQEGLKPCRVVAAKTNALRADMNPLGEFLASHCILSPHTQVDALVLRQEYEEWCKANGARPINSKEWGDRLRAVGGEQARAKRNGRKFTIWRGIGLQADDSSELDEDEGDTGTHQTPLSVGLPQCKNKNHSSYYSQNTPLPCPPVPLEDKPTWKPKPGDLVRLRDGMGNLLGGDPWRVISVDKDPRAGIEYARVEREGDEPCSWHANRVEPWKEPKE